MPLNMGLPKIARTRSRPKLEARLFVNCGFISIQAQKPGFYRVAL